MNSDETTFPYRVPTAARTASARSAAPRFARCVVGVVLLAGVAGGCGNNGGRGPVADGPAITPAPERPEEAATFVSTPLELPVKRIPQKSRNWCWAATAEMICRFYGIDSSQCAQVCKRLDTDHVCTPGDTAPLPNTDTTGWPFFTQQFGFNEALVRYTLSPLTWREVQQQLKDSHPLAYAYYHPGKASGHMVVIYGIDVSGGNRYIYIRDPNPDAPDEEGLILWNNYRSQFHWRTYSDIIPSRSQS